MDTNAVVNPDPSFKGIEDLRVFEAPVMHNMVSANSNAVTLIYNQ